VGTSKSQPSPRTPNWRAAQLAYARPDVTIDRAVQEIWRAATNQPSGDLTQLLREPAIAECVAIAAEAPNRESAVDAVSRHIASLGKASLGLVMAQRAVAQSYGKADPVAAFTSSLFSEAGNYLVSRDLPGFVGAAGRAKTTSEAMALKAELRERVAERASEIKPPRRGALVDGWSDYVTRVVQHLRETGKPR
jgi:hypothetical protein